jgi:peptidoglycan/xylan/chitin deacetylase (PgdA/CDA1 family)
MAPVNCLTVDLEPWMCFYENPDLNKRIDCGLTVSATQQLLDLFEKHDVKATFFILGKVYEWYPELIGEIAQSGHEIAFHGHTHKRILNEYSLYEELSMSKAFLKKFGVRGFRAPGMYLPDSCFKVLSGNGFKYDSSTYSAVGKPIDLGSLIEVPVSTYPLTCKASNVGSPRPSFKAVGDFEIPFGSGLFVAVLSLRLLNALINSFNRMGRSAVMFIHPWQLIVDKINTSKSLREYFLKFPYKIRIKKEKLEALLRQHSFTTVNELIKEL